MGHGLPAGARLTPNDGHRVSELRPIGPDFNNLVDSLIRRNVKVILFRNCRRDEPGPGGQQDEGTNRALGAGRGTYRPPMK